MNTKEILENIENYKKDYGKNNFHISFDDFDKEFYATDYLLSKSTPYLDTFFFETTFQIINNMMKHALQDLEYYVNVKPQTPISTSDYEVVKDNKELLKLQLEMHQIYKSSNLLWLEHKENSIDVKETTSIFYHKLVEFRKQIIEIQKKLITNLDSKIKELKEEDKPKFESSIFH